VFSTGIALPLRVDLRGPVGVLLVEEVPVLVRRARVEAGHDPLPERGELHREEGVEPDRVDRVLLRDQRVHRRPRDALLVDLVVVERERRPPHRVRPPTTTSQSPSPAPLLEPEEGVVVVEDRDLAHRPSRRREDQPVRGAAGSLDRPRLQRPQRRERVVGSISTCTRSNDSGRTIGFSRSFWFGHTDAMPAGVQDHRR
jgi:hypothetical protein